MKLKLYKCKGANSYCRKFYYKKYFHCVYKRSSLSCWKKSAPAPRKIVCLQLKKIKYREHSPMPTLPGTATAF